MAVAAAKGKSIWHLENLNPLLQEPAGESVMHTRRLQLISRKKPYWKKSPVPVDVIPREEGLCVISVEVIRRSTVSSTSKEIRKILLERSFPLNTIRTEHLSSH